MDTSTNYGPAGTTTQTTRFYDQAGNVEETIHRAEDAEGNIIG